MTAETAGTLLTGSTGFLGGEVLSRLLVREQTQVYVLMRAESDEQATLRARETVTGLLGANHPAADRVIAVAGDVTRPGLGLSARKEVWLAERVENIIHCAASVSFTLGLDEFRAINVEGTRRMLNLAELSAARGVLRSFTHVSTAYVAGTCDGLFTEEDLDVGQGFHNAYERTKFEAELLVRERAAALPVQIVRPSIVVGDSRSGWTPAFNVLYAPLRAFSSGSYPALPARRSGAVDVVPVDYVADGILALSGREGTTHHLVAGRRASTVGEIVDLAAEFADRDAPRLLPPGLYRRTLHPLLVRLGSERRRRALRMSEQFFPYLALRVRYDDAQAERALRPLGIEPPPLRSYFDRLMDFATAADWGRSPFKRHETFVTPSRSAGPIRERIKRRRAFLRALEASQR
jgi:thioester reductase-like protein